jgi:hypothetical protein
VFPLPDSANDYNLKAIVKHILLLISWRMS